jgi:hypothetical protein
MTLSDALSPSSLMALRPQDQSAANSRCIKDLFNDRKSLWVHNLTNLSSEEKAGYKMHERGSQCLQSIPLQAFHT